MVANQNQINQMKPRESPNHSKLSTTQKLITSIVGLGLATYIGLAGYQSLNNRSNINTISNQIQTMQQNIQNLGTENNSLGQEIDKLDDKISSKQSLLENYLKDFEGPKAKFTIFVDEQTPNSQLLYNTKTNKVSFNGENAGILPVFLDNLLNGYSNLEAETPGEKNTTTIMKLLATAYDSGNMATKQVERFSDRLGKIYDNQNSDAGNYAYASLQNQLERIIDKN